MKERTSADSGEASVTCEIVPFGPGLWSVLGRDWARLIGLPGKIGVDGSQIEGMHNAGKLEQIQHYCLGDVAQTAFLFLRFRLLQGVLSSDDYRRIATELAHVLRADGRLDGLMDAVDEERLLLAEPATAYVQKPVDFDEIAHHLDGGVPE